MKHGGFQLFQFIIQGIYHGEEEIHNGVLFWDKLSSGLPFPGLTCYAINRAYLRNCETIKMPI